VCCAFSPAGRYTSNNRLNRKQRHKVCSPATSCPTGRDWLPLDLAEHTAPVSAWLARSRRRQRARGRAHSEAYERRTGAAQELAPVGDKHSVGRWEPLKSLSSAKL